MLTVLSWLWGQPGGRATYTGDHVNIWADMVRRHLSMDHEIAIVTDIPEDIDPSIRIIRPPGDFEGVTLPTWGADRGLPQCLRRLAMYRPDAADWIGERFVSMDLDCVIADSLDPLFDRDEDFLIYRGTTEKRPYNGSMQMMTAGARSQVFTEFTPERAVEAGKLFVGSDQAWISHVLGWGETTWGHEDGVVWWGSHRNAAAPTHRVMFFPGNPKPWDMPNDHWINMHYRRADEFDAIALDYQKRTGMITVTNKLNSPVQLATSRGPVFLGPKATVNIDGFAPGYEAHYRASMFFEITDVSPVKPDPLDHDGDGEKGGSVPAEDRGLDGLRADAEGLGVVVDKRWGAKRLQAEIDKALAA